MSNQALISLTPKSKENRINKEDQSTIDEGAEVKNIPNQPNGNSNSENLEKSETIENKESTTNNQAEPKVEGSETDL